MDVSDGLSTDLKHLCDSSHLSAELMLPAVPIHPLASSSLDLALHGGEDYELLFSAKPATRIPALIRRRKLTAGGWEHRFG
jgi:thiamine-monophosphate kinase